MPTVFDESRLQAGDRIVALANFPGLYNLADVLPAALTEPTGKGRRSAYPDLACAFTVFAARAAGSQKAAIELLQQGLWSQCADHYFRNTGVQLPSIPPGPVELSRRVAGWTADPALVERLSEAFSGMAVQLSRILGQFQPGAPRDWAKPDWHHQIQGDGVHVRRHTDVRWQDGKLVGSRAKDPARARIQLALTDGREDGKSSVHGINNVLVYTWSDFGGVVLGVDFAMGAEVHAFDKLIDRLVPTIGDGLHTVVWDRAATGWRNEWLMAQHQVALVTKGVARAKSSNTMGSKELKYTASTIGVDEAIALYKAGQPLPLGTNVYPTSLRQGEHQFEVIRGRFYPLKIDAEAGCVHELWVDDRALVAVEREQGSDRRYKVATARLVRAVPETSVDGHTNLLSTWQLDCAVRRHKFQLRWQPRRDSHGKQVTDPWQKAVNALGIPPRSDDQFGDVNGRRNTTESFNNWYQANLAPWREGESRAARLDPLGQKLDLIGAAMVWNSITYNRWLNAQR